MSLQRREDRLIVPADAYAEPDQEVPLPTDKDVPYLPTDQNVVHKMLEVARVRSGDVLYDLGCGDGRICITAAKLGARAVGVEIDLALLRECQNNLRNTGLRDRVEFRRQSFFDVDLRPATVVTLYLLPQFNKRLRPKLLWELRPGARIVANYFEIADWKPDEQTVFKHRPIMLWIVPAWVGGRYKCLWAGPEGRGPRRHARLELTRNFQFLTGTMTFGDKRAEVTGRIRGSEVELTVSQSPLGPASARVVATYREGELRGHFMSSGAAGVFVGQRTEGEAHAPPAAYLGH